MLLIKNEGVEAKQIVFLTWKAFDIERNRAYRRKVKSSKNRNSKAVQWPANQYCFNTFFVAEQPAKQFNYEYKGIHLQVICM